MILADKIVDLRKKCGWSQEELAERLGVSRQSISKWEGAQSVPDMNRILAMADLFGVTTDYLLRDELGPEEDHSLPLSGGDANPPARKVTMEEANAFLAARDRHASRVALGVMLCILSPVLLILLGGAQEAGAFSLSQDRAAGLGLIVLILLIAAAVALFVTGSLRMNRFEYLEKEYIDTEYGVDGMVRERQERFRPAFGHHLTLGIVLCVVSILPLFSILAFSPRPGVTLVRGLSLPQDMAYAAAAALLLVLVAVGVFLIVRCCMVRASYQMLLEEGDYSRPAKLEARRNANIAAIYWGTMTAAYLLWSFLSGRWDMTWILWPVAGVLYGVLCAALRALRKDD